MKSGTNTRRNPGPQIDHLWHYRPRDGVRIQNSDSLRPSAQRFSLRSNSHHFLQAPDATKTHQRQQDARQIFMENDNSRNSTNCQGQFHANKTRFEVTISKTSFLGPNLLVRPHVVHQVQFWPPSAILRPFLGSEWVFGPNWDQISKSLQEAIFMYFFELFAPKQLQLVYF